MKARVHVFYKESVFDPQGNTLTKTLNGLGFNRIKGVRVGKVIDLEMEQSSEQYAREDLKKICESLLANPVIETFKFEFIDDQKR